MSHVTQSLSLMTLEETAAFAGRLATHLRAGDVITLQGDLGAGKTTFTQFLIQALSADPVEVTSPTFNLLQTYPITVDGRPCECSHYDLYRVETESALQELGFEEALHGITIIEWPERLGGYKLPVSLALRLTLADDGSRRMAFDSPDARWEDIVV